MREQPTMEYKFTQGSPISEADALAEAAELGYHGLAFDLIVTEDEPIHWHEFNSVSWVIAGTGSVRYGDGTVIEVSPGCRLEAPAGLLHSALAGPPIRLVVSTDLPYEQWTMPIDKDPADRPEHLTV
jgi:mannose-6-phosphate isomerase-like protein (cupin superfamily)